MKNAERIYKEYMERLMPGKMELIILETEDWTNNFAVIQTNWEGSELEELTIKDYSLYWIPSGDIRPQPIRAYSKLNNAIAAFFQLKYSQSKYTEYPF